MTYPALFIDSQKIEHNARIVTSMLKGRGIDVVAVPKSTLCHPAVVNAMVKGGAKAIGDSRMENLRRARQDGYSGEAVLLRAPSPARCPEAVEVSDVGLNTEVETVRLLGRAARRRGKDYKVVLMVDLGDLREGVLPERAPSVAKEMASVPGIILHGVGVNLTCYGGVIPTTEKMEELLATKEAIESVLGTRLEVVSGGNSANILMTMEGKSPQGVNQLRIGESIILGTEAVKKTVVPGCHTDAIVIAAEIIEIQRKPSKPIGEIGINAFGAVVTFPDRGVRCRAICAVGRQDLDHDGLTPLYEGIEVIGSSSDHIIVDVEGATGLEIGSVLSFIPSYGSLLKAATSPFVEKVVI